MAIAEGAELLLKAKLFPELNCYRKAKFVPLCHESAKGAPEVTIFYRLTSAAATIWLLYSRSMQRLVEVYEKTR